jgi:S1-C subfamily serine protease
MKNRFCLVKMALLLALTIVLSSITFAAEPNKYQPYAEALKPLGVFIGTDNGFELERVPTRVEGIVLLIRLLGAEATAQEMHNQLIPFTDVPTWANGYVAYAFENALTRGTSSTRFSANEQLDGNMFCTFLLRSLGYFEQDGDYTYNTALSYALKIGLLQPEQYDEITENKFVRGHVAKLAYDTLNFDYKGSNTALLRKLVAEGRFSSSQASRFFESTVRLADTPDYRPIMTLAELEEYTSFIVQVDSDANNYACSGVFIDGEGTIVTSYPLLYDANSIKLKQSNNTIIGEIYVQDYDSELGIMVLKTTFKPKKYAKIGDIATLKEGGAVVSIGYKMNSFTNMGSGKVEEISTYLIKNSAFFNPGNGLFNMHGELVGIQISRTGGTTDSYAIPINLLDQLSEKKMLTFAEFRKIADEVKPPTNTYIVEETGKSVFLSWDSVQDADYYHVYFNTTRISDIFGFDSDANNPLRPKKIHKTTFDNYGFYYEFRDLQPNEQCNIAVTTVKDGIESKMSKVFSFKKKAMFSIGNQAIPPNYYSRATWLPDFGAIYGHKAFDHLASLKGILLYSYSDNVLFDEVKGYVKLLEDKGFKENKFLTKYLNSINYSYAVVYTNTDVGKHVELIYDESDASLTMWIDT